MENIRWSPVEGKVVLNPIIYLQGFSTIQPVVTVAGFLNANFLGPRVGKSASATNCTLPKKKHGDSYVTQLRPLQKHHPTHALLGKLSSITSFEGLLRWYKETRATMPEPRQHG